MVVISYLLYQLLMPQVYLGSYIFLMTPRGLLCLSRTRKAVDVFLKELIFHNWGRKTCPAREGTTSKSKGKIKINKIQMAFCSWRELLAGCGDCRCSCVICINSALERNVENIESSLLISARIQTKLSRAEVCLASAWIFSAKQAHYFLYLKTVYVSSVWMRSCKKKMLDVFPNVTLSGRLP